MSNATLPPGRQKISPSRIASQPPHREAGLPSTPKPTGLPGAGEIIAFDDLALRIAKGIVEPAFNRAAGVIVGWSLAQENPLAVAESLAGAVEAAFNPGERKQAGTRFIRSLRERIAAVAVEMGL